ncbi:MAG: LPS export ABC transporter periplasmic protein LptC [Planctomycetes bacterium]|nr:LPS export ABC transporter periplasmic protein LptC [Planctomycetota bacterium]
MSRRRLILIGIIVGCAVFIVLASMEVFKSPQPKSKGEQVAVHPFEEPPGLKPGAPPPSRITDVEYPEYDESGRKKYVVKAKEAFEQMGMRNMPVRLVNTVIEIYKKLPQYEGDKGIIEIMAPEGTYDPKTKFAELRKDVVIQVDPQTRIRTKAVSYIPTDNKVFTKEKVALDGKDLSIEGTELEADLNTEVVRLKRDVRVVVRGTKGFSFNKKDKEKDKQKGPKEKGKLTKLDEPITITCKNEMVFVLSKETGHRATFHKNAVVTKGKSRLDADQLEITFTREADAVRKVIATGNVSFADKDAKGSADKIVWEADKESVTLTSKNVSEVNQGPNQLKARTIYIYQAKEEMRVDGAGQLKVQTKSGLKPDREKKDKKPTPKIIQVFWQRDMLYHANQAVFRGHVKVVEQEGMQLDAETLTVSFGKDRGKVEKVLAEGNVKMRDGTRTGRGDRFEWNAAMGVGVLTSNNTVTVTDADNRITAKTLRFSQTDDRIEAEGAGFLAGKQGDKKDEAIHVIWEQSMEFDRKNHLATFVKNVEAARGEAKLRAQKLEILFDDQNKKVQKIIATEKVTVEQGKQTGRGEKAIYNAATEQAVLYGGADLAEVRQEESRSIRAPVIYLSQKAESIHTEKGGNLVFKSEEKKGEAKNVSVTWAGTMDFNPERHKATFTKNVRAQQGERKINADQVNVFFDGKNREVRNVVAQGHVKLTEGNRKGRGDLFSWNSVTGKVELSGKPAVMETGQGFCIESAIVRQYQEEDRMEAEGVGRLEFDNPHKKLADGKKPGDKIRVVWRDRLIFPRREGKATFYGDVVVTSGTKRLEMQRLEIYLDEKEEPKEMRAYENVIVSDTPVDGKGRQKKPVEATGEKLVWTAANDTAVLSGADANVFHAGRRVGGGATWEFTGFFAGNTGEKRVKTKSENGPVVIRIPEKITSSSR